MAPRRGSDDDALYARAYNGQDSRWRRAAVRQKAGQIMTMRTAVITGANRGIGFETCRQLGTLGCRVVLTARDQARGLAAAQSLIKQGLTVEFRLLDVADLESIREIRASLEADFGGVDVLVNNAAVYPDEGISVVNVNTATVRATLETNLLGHGRCARPSCPV